MADVPDFFMLSKRKIELEKERTEMRTEETRIFFLVLSFCKEETKWQTIIGK